MASRTRPEQAALAFSALRAHEAERIVKQFSLVERTRLRETLTRLRSATDDERQAALRELVDAVRAPIAFPVPLAHEEERCAFRVLEEREPDVIAVALARLGVTDRLLVAVALCHFSAEYREEVWARLPSATRAATRPLLGQVPTISHARTRRYAQDLVRRVSSSPGSL